MAGLDSTGFSIKRQPEIIQEIVEDQRSLIDPDIDTRDDELLGQLNTIISSAVADQWELAQGVNDNGNVLKAEGKNLDDHGALTATFRQAGSFSTTTSQLFVAEEASTIPAGRYLQNPTTLDKFVIVADIDVSSTACISTDLRVSTVLDLEPYTVSVDGRDYTFTSGNNATALEIINGLKALIDADSGKTWDSSVDTENEILSVFTLAATISVYTVVNFLVLDVTVLGEVSSEVEGRVISPSNSVTTILSSISGLISTTNPDAYVVGRLRESDEDYRNRILISQQTRGKATVPAIRSAVRNVQGVTTALVIENDTGFTDSEGRPDHSFEVVVQGGSDQDIADAIYDSKPAGIPSFGTTSAIVTIEGFQNTVYLTRPVAVHLAYLVEYTLYEEETFPATGEASMALALVNSTAALGVDKDVIPNRHKSGIYQAVSGIDDLVIKVQELSNPTDTPVELNWQTSRLPINFKQFANTATTSITINEV